MTTKTTEKIVAELLIKSKSLLLSPESPFLFASGIYSPIWIDGRRIASYPEERAEIMDMLAKKIDNKIGKENVDIIAGTASSGISLATFVSRRLRKPMIYVRISSKKHGKGKQIEGEYEKGKKVVLLTDVVSAPKDVIKSTEALKEAGMKVMACFGIHDNRIEAIKDFFKKEKIPLYTLTNIDVLLSVAEKTGFMSAKEKDIAISWLKDPKKWLSNHTKSLKEVEEKRKKRIAEILLEIGAVALSPKKPYTYASGILSPIYTDNRLLMSHPEEWEEVMKAFAETITTRIGRQNVEIIAGTDSAGISHASYLASLFHLPLVYIKSEETIYGKRRKIEGVITPGNHVVIVEDLISTGSSSLSATDTARNAGATADFCLAIFDYRLEEAKKAFFDKKITLLSMTDIDTLLEVAIEKKIIDETERKIVLEWQKDPEGWGERQNE